MYIGEEEIYNGIFQTSVLSLKRLSGRKVCERVKLKGMSWKGKHLHARFLRVTPRAALLSSPTIFLGLVTSAKLHPSAVKRNRMRRRCKEALRILLKEAHERSGGTFSKDSLSVQLLLLPRSSSLSAPFTELQADVSSLLQFLFPSSRARSNSK